MQPRVPANAQGYRRRHGESQNKQYHFKAKLLQLGSYTHKFQVDVDGVEVLFEADEDRSYRAWIDPANQEALTKVNPHLLKEIALAIESIVN